MQEPESKEKGLKGAQKRGEGQNKTSVKMRQERGDCKLRGGVTRERRKIGNARVRGESLPPGKDKGREEEGVIVRSTSKNRRRENDQERVETRRGGKNWNVENKGETCYINLPG